MNTATLLHRAASRHHWSPIRVAVAVGDSSGSLLPVAPTGSDAPRPRAPVPTSHPAPQGTTQPPGAAWPDSHCNTHFPGRERLRQSLLCLQGLSMNRPTLSASLAGKPAPVEADPAFHLLS